MTSDVHRMFMICLSSGTALDALSSMQSFLRGRPKVFKSVDGAIEWWYVLVALLSPSDTSVEL